MICSGGLRERDIVQDINGQKVMSVADVYRAVDSGRDLEVTVIRSNRIVILTIIPERVD